MGEYLLCKNYFVLFNNNFDFLQKLIPILDFTQKFINFFKNRIRPFKYAELRPVLMVFRRYYYCFHGKEHSVHKEDYCLADSGFTQ